MQPCVEVSRLDRPRASHPCTQSSGPPPTPAIALRFPSMAGKLIPRFRPVQGVRISAEMHGCGKIPRNPAIGGERAIRQWGKTASSPDELRKSRKCHSVGRQPRVPGPRSSPRPGHVGLYGAASPRRFVRDAGEKGRWHSAIGPFSSTPYLLYIEFLHQADMVSCPAPCADIVFRFAFSPA
jgi:hypothetical protein